MVQQTCYLGQPCENLIGIWKLKIVQTATGFVQLLFIF